MVFCTVRRVAKSGRWHESYTPSCSFRRVCVDKKRGAVKMETSGDQAVREIRKETRTATCQERGQNLTWGLDLEVAKAIPLGENVRTGRQRLNGNESAAGRREPSFSLTFAFSMDLSVPGQFNSSLCKGSHAQFQTACARRLSCARQRRFQSHGKHFFGIRNPAGAHFATRIFLRWPRIRAARFPGEESCQARESG